MSLTNCCRCDRVGMFSDEQGHLYCLEHWHKQETETNCGSDCGKCTACASPRCAVKGCDAEGIILQGGSGKLYCVDHAWETSRPKEAGMEEKKKSLDDVGTRQEHLSDLYEQWSFGLEFLSRKSVLDETQSDVGVPERKRAVDIVGHAIYAMPTSTSVESEKREKAQRAMNLITKTLVPDISEQRRQSLEHAVELLYHALSTDYDCTKYSSSINCEYKASEIEGGRGTPLEENDETKST